MFVSVKILEVLEHWILIEFNNVGVQRKYIPRAIYNTSIKGPATLGIEVVSLGMEYSNVDIPELFGELDNFESERLQNALRDAGLWLCEDYLKNPMTVVSVLKSFRPALELDATTVINRVNFSGGNND